MEWKRPYRCNGHAHVGNGIFVAKANDWVAGTCIKESTAAAILETIYKIGFLYGASVGSYIDQILPVTTTGDICSGIWLFVRNLAKRLTVTR